MIAFVTTNEGKFREVSAKLLEAAVRVVHEDRSYPEIQTDRLEKVVRFAATVLDDQIRGDYLIDDSGLFLDAFGGFPGVYSSDRKSTRLNSSHRCVSYAVFCLKK